MYATLSDIETIYSRSVLDRVAYNPDLDPPGRDAAMIERALEEASNEINMYVSVAYNLPLPRVPPMLRSIAVDIALYRMCLTADKMTDQIENRYKMAVRSLERVSAGTAGLGVPDRDADGNDDGMGQTPGEFGSISSVRA